MATPPKPHGRLGLPKTTTGCKTCKARKIKCDEAKPECFRCTRSRKKCLGYERWQVVKPNSYHGQISSRGSFRKYPSMSPGTEAEMVHFQYFIEHASRCIAGVLDLDFWSRLLPRISQTEPAVRFSIIAISSLFRHRYTDLPHLPNFNPSTNSDTDTSLHLKYYGKAINAAVQGMGRDVKDALIAVVTCVLFFCIESLQQRIHQAVNLYHRGQTLIDQIEKQPGSTNTETMNIIRSDIQPMFSRLRVLTALHGSTPTSTNLVLNQKSVHEDLQHSFTTIEEARTRLFDLTAAIHYFIAKSFRDKWTAGLHLLEQLESRRALLATRLSTWRLRASAVLQLSSLSHGFGHQTSTIQIARLVLSCHHLIIYICLDCALQHNESSFDEHLAVFRTIVDLSARTLQLKRQTVPDSQTYTFEMGIIPPLFMTVRKCRDPVIRRRAISLLKEGPAQEGLWNANHAIDVAVRCINLEEEGLSGHASQRPWPREEARLHETIITFRTQKEDGRSGAIARFFRKEGHDWEIWEEWFDA